MTWPTKAARAITCADGGLERKVYIDSRGWCDTDEIAAIIRSHAPDTTALEADRAEYMSAALSRGLEIAELRETIDDIMKDRRDLIAENERLRKALELALAALERAKGHVATNERSRRKTRQAANTQIRAAVESGKAALQHLPAPPTSEPEGAPPVDGSE